MSKLTEALEVIQNECDEHFMCDTCPLRCRDEYGIYGCRLDYWGITKEMETDRERGFTGHSRARRVKQYLKALWMPIHFWEKIDAEGYGA